jgi:predicted alpha/beta superfamily hydrolase
MLDVFPIQMTTLNQERLIRVYLPKCYSSEDKHYPVMYMHDGQNVFTDDVAINGVSLNLESYLDEKGLEVIVVGIDQNPEDRLNEYCPWVNGEYSKKILGPESSPTGGKGSSYIEFIVYELKPFIDQKYRTLVDQTSMAGISLGGLISTYAACRYPQLFKNIAIFSSGFYRNQEEIEKLLIESDLSPIQSFYLDCGTKEAGDNEQINSEVLSSNKAIYDILRNKISNIRFEIIEDASHNYMFFRKRVPSVFTNLYEGK